MMQADKHGVSGAFRLDNAAATDIAMDVWRRFGRLVASRLGQAMRLQSLGVQAIQSQNTGDIGRSCRGCLPLACVAQLGAMFGFGLRPGRRLFSCRCELVDNHSRSIRKLRDQLQLAAHCLYVPAECRE